MPDRQVFCIKHRLRNDTREQLRQGAVRDTAVVIDLWVWERWFYEDLWEQEPPEHVLPIDELLMRHETQALQHAA